METKPRFVDEFGGAKAVEGTVPKQFACEAYQKDFLAKLTDATVLDSERIDEVRGLLGDGKKVKAEDLVRILPRFLQAEISSDQTRIRPHRRSPGHTKARYRLPEGYRGEALVAPHESPSGSLRDSRWRG